MRGLVYIGACVAASICISPIAYANDVRFHIQVAPLECSLDTVALGQSISQHLTPEDCHPFSAQIGTIPASVAALSSTVPGRLPPVSSSHPAVSVPTTGDAHTSTKVSETNKQPYKEVSTERLSLLSMYPFVALSLIAIIDVIPSGVLSPLSRQMRLIRVWWRKD